MSTCARRWRWAGQAAPPTPSSSSPRATRRASRARCCSSAAPSRSTPAPRRHTRDTTVGAGLIGRGDELRRVDEVLDAATTRGGGLVIRGEPGIGKSALLAHAVERARERGFHVVSTVGVESEGNLPFAGLHRLLRPLLDGLVALPRPQP